MPVATNMQKVAYWYAVQVCDATMPPNGNLSGTKSFNVQRLLQVPFLKY